MIDIINKVQKEIYGHLNAFNKGSIDRDSVLERQLRSVIDRQNAAQQLGAIEQQKRFVAHMYQQSSAYTNLIMIAGYAGIFGLWQITKAQLSSFTVNGVASLIAFSLLVFVAFEVKKMVSMGFFMRRLNRILAENFEPAERVRAWEEALVEWSAKEGKNWVVYLMLTIVPGFGAGGWLLVEFLRSLWYG
jgi:hypothetical protein